MRADVELGGTDQKFNLLLARDIQQAYGVPPQSVLTTPILPGIDGVQRMSKSLGNYVGVTDPPEEIFGKLMRVPDSAMPVYYDLLLDCRARRVAPGGGAQARAWPGALTAQLPRRGGGARRPRPTSTACTSTHEVPEDVEELELPARQRHRAPSRAAARRLRASPRPRLAGCWRRAE